MNADRYTLRNGNLTAELMAKGATLTGLYLDSVEHSLVLGSENLADYDNCLRYAGAVVGPVANRIAQSRFQLGGQQYEVSANFLGKHCLHGGEISPSDREWTVLNQTDSSMRFGLSLDHLEQGFPGPIEAQVEYRLTDNSALEVEITVSSNQLTVCNWTQHSYFNLDGSADLSQHQLQVFAEKYLPVNEELIPTGEVADVANSDFDYRQLRSLKNATIDHNFCLANERSNEPRPQAILRSALTGIEMLVESTEPGLQVYTGDHLTSGECAELQKAGLALEPQGWPDAPNQPHFPSINQAEGSHYCHLMRFTFRLPGA